MKSYGQIIDEVHVHRIRTGYETSKAFINGLIGYYQEIGANHMVYLLEAELRATEEFFHPDDSFDGISQFVEVETEEADTVRVLAVSDDGVTGQIESATVDYIIAEFAKMLHTTGAKNYLELEFCPSSEAPFDKSIVMHLSWKGVEYTAANRARILQGILSDITADEPELKMYIQEPDAIHKDTWYGPDLWGEDASKS